MKCKVTRPIPANENHIKMRSGISSEDASLETVGDWVGNEDDVISGIRS